MAQTNLSITLSGRDNLTPVIRNAQRALEDLGERSTKLEDIQKGFDKIKNSSAPLSRKISDIRKQMEALLVSGEKTTDQGEEMYKRLSEAAKEYDRQLRQIQQDTRNIGNESSEVDGIGGKKFDLKNIDLKGIGSNIASSVGLGGIADMAGSLVSALNPATVAIGAVAGTMVAAGKAASEFETHLNSLQALTGLTDDEMKAINDGAIEMSKSFHSSAGEIVDAMKLIGSQAPELLKDSDALMEVTKAANVLSEAAEISVEDAAKAITGTMNQMGASASEATDIINTFAAASQQGSADVAYLNKAFEKSGTAASSAGMDYVQLASAIESIAPKFSSADVAGSQLASTLLKLSMSGNSDFMPSVVGMSKALENLAKAEMDDAAMKNLVGESNITMLKSLIDAKDQFDIYSKSLKGTNTAYEQMEINGKGLKGSIDGMKSAWDAFLLTLGQTSFMQNIMEGISVIVDAIGEIINIVGDVLDSFDLFEGAADPLWLLKDVFDSLVKTIKGIGVAIEIVVALCAKAWNAIVDSVKWASNKIKEGWDSVLNKLMENKFVNGIVKSFNQIYQKFQELIVKIKKAWNATMEFLGLDKHKVEIKVEKSEIEKVEENKPTTTNNNAPIPATEEKKEKGKKTSSKSTKTEKIDYLVSVDDQTLDTAEKKLSAWQSKLKTIKIDDVEGLKKANEEIKKWQEEVNKRKLIIEFGNGIFDSIDYLKKQLGELESRKQEIEFAIEVNSINAEEQIIDLDRRIKELKSKEIDLTVNNSTEELDTIRDEISDLTRQKYLIQLSISSNSNEIENIIKELGYIDDKYINVSVNTDSSKLTELNTQIDELKNKILIETIKIGFVPEIEKGSKADIENEIKKLEEAKKILFQINADPSTIKMVDDEIKTLKGDLEKEEIRLGIKPFIENGSLADIKKRIKEKEEEIQLALNTNIDPDSMKKLQKELDGLRKEEEAKEIELGIKYNISSVRMDDDKKWEKGSLDDRRQSLANSNSKAEQVKSDYSLGLINAEEAKEQLARIKEELKAIFPELDINLHFNDDGTITTADEDLEKLKNKIGETSDIVGSFGNVFSSLGGAIEDSAGQVLQFAGQSLNAISQIIPQVATLIAAKQAEAMASGTASGAALPFPANLAAIASIVATIAGIFTSLPKFESGGVVGGTSYYGDKLLARVNSGELILNKAQQSKLYKTIESSEVGKGNVLKGDVNFTISGSALKGTLRNYDQKMSKIK